MFSRASATGSAQVSFRRRPTSLVPEAITDDGGRLPSRGAGRCGVDRWGVAASVVDGCGVDGCGVDGGVTALRSRSSGAPADR